jgi:hypothetical protein
MWAWGELGEIMGVGTPDIIHRNNQTHWLEKKKTMNKQEFIKNISTDSIHIA